MAEAMAVVAEEGEQDGNRQGRRRHNFQKLASESYHKSVFGPDSELPAPVRDTHRDAARRWAKENEIAVADFSSPRAKPEGYHYTVAQCNACVDCSAWFRFEGSWNSTQDAFQLTVHQSGVCGGQPKKARKARVAQREDCQPTVEDVRRFHLACDELCKGSLKITPSAVAVRLGKENRIAATALKNLVKSRKKSCGPMTRRFIESVETFLEYSESRRDDGAGELHFHKVCARRDAFKWVATLPSFWKLLEDQKNEKGFQSWCVTSDFTHRLSIQGYQVGFLSAIVFRRLGGRSRRTSWPLVAMCEPRERTSAYADAFEVVVQQCTARGLPIPSQLHIDWFGGVAGDAGAVGASWKRHAGSRVINGLEHMVRNLELNQRRGSAYVTSKFFVLGLLLRQSSSAHVHALTWACFGAFDI